MTLKPLTHDFPLASDLSRRPPRLVATDELLLELEDELDRRKTAFPRLVERHTITEEEAGIMHTHAAHLGDLLEKGVLILAGPTFGEVNTGIAVIEAEDEDAARAVMMSDPAVASGLMTPELRPMRVSFLRGRA